MRASTSTLFSALWKRNRDRMLSANLEQTLHRALAGANERRHEYATLEHLLLALLDDPDAMAMLRACSVDLERLRADILDYEIGRAHVGTPVTNAPLVCRPHL